MKFFIGVVYMYETAPVVVLNSLAVVSMDAVAISCFWGSNWTTTTSPECPVNVCLHSPVSNDHKQAVLSNDPVSILSLEQKSGIRLSQNKWFHLANEFVMWWLGVGGPLNVAFKLSKLDNL